MRIHVRTLAAGTATGALFVSLALLAFHFVGNNSAGQPDDASALKGNIVFFDDFLGTSIDPAKWTVLDRLSDQANHEVNCVIPENVSVKDGLLEGVSKYEDHRCGDSLDPPKVMKYTSWQIQQATKPFLYGTIEVRAKAPGGVEYRD